MRIFIYFLFTISLIFVSCSDKKQEFFDDISGVWEIKNDNGMLLLDFRNNKKFFSIDDDTVDFIINHIDIDNNTLKLDLLDYEPRGCTIKLVDEESSNKPYLLVTTQNGKETVLELVNKDMIIEIPTRTYHPPFDIKVEYDGYNLIFYNNHMPIIRPWIPTLIDNNGNEYYFLVREEIKVYKDKPLKVSLREFNPYYEDITKYPSEYVNYSFPKDTLSYIKFGFFVFDENGNLIDGGKVKGANYEYEQKLELK